MRRKLQRPQEPLEGEPKFLAVENGAREQQIDRGVRTSEQYSFVKKRERNRRANNDIIDKIKQLQIGEEKCNESQKCVCHPAAAACLQPVFARRGLQMPDKINEGHDNDGKEI